MGSLNLYLGFNVILKVIKIPYRYFGLNKTILGKIIHERNNTFIGKLIRKRYAKKASKQIKNSLGKDLNQEVVVCYDIHCSPPTIGDFLNVAMLARYLCFKGMTVKFYVVCSEPREGWKALNHSEKNELFEIMKKIIQILLPFNCYYYERVTWKEFKKILGEIYHSDQAKKNQVLQHQKILKRRSIYNHAFNILNHLTHKETEKFLNEFLLNIEDFSRYRTEASFINNKFVCWHLRYNVRWGLDRNLTENQVNGFLAKIKKENPNKKILIVSDELGTAHYKKMTKLSCNQVLFSKDYGNSFFKDAWFILKSEKYYQYRGGGIGMIAIFSNVKYEIIDPCSNEISWRYPNFTSWSLRFDQKRYFLLDELINKKIN